MTDWKALCEELADSIELLLEMRPADAKPLSITEERYARARAALAAEADGPAVPEGREPAAVVGQPSDEELLSLWGRWSDGRTTAQGSPVERVSDRHQGS